MQLNEIKCDILNSVFVFGSVVACFDAFLWQMILHLLYFVSILLLLTVIFILTSEALTKICKITERSAFLVKKQLNLFEHNVFIK